MDSKKTPSFGSDMYLNDAMQDPTLDGLRKLSNDSTHIHLWTGNITIPMLGALVLAVSHCASRSHLVLPRITIHPDMHLANAQQLLTPPRPNPRCRVQGSGRCITSGELGLCCSLGCIIPSIAAAAASSHERRRGAGMKCRGPACS